VRHTAESQGVPGRGPVLTARDVAGQRDVDGTHPRRACDPQGLADLAFGVLTVEGDRLLRERAVHGIEIELLMGGESRWLHRTFHAEVER